MKGLFIKISNDVLQFLQYILSTFLVELNLVSLLTSKLNIYSHFCEITITQTHNRTNFYHFIDMDKNFHLFNLFLTADLQVSG